MFNRINKCTSEYLCILLLHVQTIQIIPKLFENGHFVVQRPNSSFIRKKNRHFLQYFSYIVAVSFIFGGQQLITGIYLKTFDSQKLYNIYIYGAFWSNDDLLW